MLHVKTLAILTFLVAGGLTSSAQQTILMIDIQPLMTEISEIHLDFVLRSEFNSSRNLWYMEEKMGLEEWMLTREKWMVPEMRGETTLIVEDWMLTSRSFEPAWEFLKVEPESPLKLEEWMICTEYWCR